MGKVSIKTLKKRRTEQLKEAFKNIDDDMMAVVEKTILYAVDLEIRMIGLQEELDRTGFIEKYCNGQNQYGTKESTASKSYSTVVKNYNSLIRTLLSCLPKNQQTDADDGLDEFLKTCKKPPR